MTENSFNLQNKIQSHQLKIVKLDAEKKLYSTGNYFDAIKVSKIERDMETEIDSINHYETLLREQKTDESYKERETLKEI